MEFDNSKGKGSILAMVSTNSALSEDLRLND